MRAGHAKADCGVVNTRKCQNQIAGQAAERAGGWEAGGWQAGGQAGEWAAGRAKTHGRAKPQMTCLREIPK